MKECTLLKGWKEADIEGIARYQNTFYVAGSHSLKRKTISTRKTYEQNRKRITKVKAEAGSDHIFRLTIDPISGRPGANIDGISLRKILQRDKTLGIFTGIPSKENGVDIEGIATDGEHLYLGFRGPVLRSNYVPVMVTSFDKPQEYTLRYINLGGHGIRDITRVSNGFLIISGPVGDGPGSYRLYFWDGSDGIPGRDKEISPVVFLGDIPHPRGTKAEGLTILQEDELFYEIMVVYDNIRFGSPTLFRVNRLTH